MLANIRQFLLIIIDILKSINNENKNNDNSNTIPITTNNNENNDKYNHTMFIGTRSAAWTQACVENLG